MKGQESTSCMVPMDALNYEKSRGGSLGFSAAKAIAGVAAVAVSLVAAVTLGGTGLGLGLGIGAGIGASSGPAAVAAASAVPASALAGVAAVAAAAAGSLVWHRGKHGLEEPSLSDNAKDKPLLEVDRNFQELDLDLEESAPEAEKAEPPLKKRRPFRKKRAQFLGEARKRVASWVTLLIRGIELDVDGEVREVKLQRPRRDKLVIGYRAFPLVGLALQLEGQVLTVVADISDSIAGCDNEQPCRTFRIHFLHSQMALEFALTLKVLRAGADTGAGIYDWGERQPDHLKRPEPAE